MLSRLRAGLRRTRDSLLSGIGRILSGRADSEEVMIDQMEEFLLSADVGVSTSEKLAQKLRTHLREGGAGAGPDLLALMKKEILDVMKRPLAESAPGGRPHVTLVVGVNGSGKTTTVGKLAKYYADRGEKVLIACSDTFRAAAGEQLEVWAKRAGVDIVRQKSGADAASVAYDGAEAGLARAASVVLVDTAGRLHTKVNLMEELKKIRKVLARKIEGSPQEVLLVLDASTGQNALIQAREFGSCMGVTGIALTKLDGTAKGGVVVAIASELDIPVKFLGVGESLEDLVEFDPIEFADALLSEENSPSPLS
ncbi:MAG: signal recognition particle-docking protein FtsY [Candidatus Eiseniibacteriota bacterium]|nr:MAG: signal recognition particle-docking protein FtsY [Candidatus Eisenbacteria bacterium]